MSYFPYQGVSDQTLTDRWGKFNGDKFNIIDM